LSRPTGSSIPRWHAGLGQRQRLTSTNSTVQQATLDYEDTSVFGHAGYTTPKGSKLRGQLRQVDGKYPNRCPAFLSTAPIR